MNKYLFIAALLLLFGCTNEQQNTDAEVSTTSEVSTKIAPKIITDTLPNDTDDPAIWVHSTDPEQSLILGTDKDSLGGIYAFNLKGRIIPEKTIYPVGRPNNIDIEYGLQLGDSSTDIAVYTERFAEKIRVISLPDMKLIDGGGIPVFEGEEPAEFRAPMGISLYKDSQAKDVYAIVSRKNGPTDSTYLWQYKLESLDGTTVAGTLVRKFGAFKPGAEIEAIAVDDDMGVVYYSDEAAGVRKYWAHPDSGNAQLALFGQEDFQEDREGIAVWKTGPNTGFIIVSDQQANRFLLYPREGTDGNPHQHELAHVWNMSTLKTDGCEVYPGYLSPKFPNGIFVAMSEGKVFHYYGLVLDH
ncbi:MAG: phytase [Bacteroidota bacterium]